MLKQFKSKAVMNQFEQFIGFVEDALGSVGMAQKNIFSLMTVSEEIIVNIIHYAYDEKPGDLEIIFEGDEQNVRLTFIDKGTPFNPLTQSQVDTSLKAHEREIGGLGIHMIKSMTDRMMYDYKEGKNILTIEKQIR